MTKSYYLKDTLDNSGMVKTEYYHSTPVKTSKGDTADIIPMTSNDAIDSDMSDKIELHSARTADTAPAETDKAKNNRPWYKKLFDNVEQAYEHVVIKAAEATGWEWLGKHANSFEDLSDDDAEALTKLNANSKHTELNARTCEANAKITDAERQKAVAYGCIINTDNEYVQKSYANGYHHLAKENQASVAGKLTEHALNDEILNDTIDNISNCSAEVQADVVDSVTGGIADNKTLSDEEKAYWGKYTVEQIPKLDQSQQEAAYIAAANNLHEYKKVVDAVKYSVIKSASKEICNAVISKLNSSEKVDLKQAFSKQELKQFIQKYETVLRKSGVDIEDILDYVYDSKKEIIYKQVLKVRSGSTHTNSQSSDVKKCSMKHLIQELESCQKTGDFKKLVKTYSTEDIRKLFANNTQMQNINLFKTSTSVYLQAFMLKNELVPYEKAEHYCLPGIQAAMDVYTMNLDYDDYDIAIQRLKIA